MRLRYVFALCARCTRPVTGGHVSTTLLSSVAIAMCLFAPVRATVDTSSAWAVRQSGVTHAVTEVDGRVILGGNFSAHFRGADQLGFIDTATGQLRGACARASRSLQSLTPDGAGGVFLSTALGTSLGNQAYADAAGAFVPPAGTAFLRVRPDCQFDRVFLPRSVDESEAISPGSILGVPGGVLATSIRPEGAQLAAFDAASGARILYRQYPGVFGLQLIAVATAQSVVVRVRDSAVSQLQSLRLLALPSLELSPPLVPLTDSNDVVWMSGGRVFVWRNPGLAPGPSPLRSFESATLQPTPGWQPPQLSNGVLTDVAKVGSRVFLAGAVDVNGQRPPLLTVLDASTGEVDATWVPPPVSSGTGVSRVLTDGARLYMEGAFRRVAGQARLRWVSLDATTGALLPWAPTVTRAGAGLGNEDRGLAFTANFIAASTIDGIEGVSRNGLVVLDRTSGAVLPADPMQFVPVSDATVWAMTSNTTHVYIGVQAPNTGFANVYRLNRSSLTWDPAWSLFVGGANAGVVRALAATDETLYLGGSFTNVSGIIGGVTLPGSARNGLAAVSLTGAEVTPWNPNVQAVSMFSSVESLALTADRLYLAGAFTAIGGQPRAGFAGVSLTDGTVVTPPVAGVTAASRVVTDGVTAFVLGSAGATPVVAAVSPQGIATVVGIVGESRAVVGLAYLNGKVYAGRERDGATLQPTGSTLRFDAAFGMTGAILARHLDLSLRLHSYSVPAVPGAPQGLQAVVTGNQVSLSWLAPVPIGVVTSPAADGVPQSYVVRAGTSSGLFNLADFDTNSLATGLTTAAPDGTYFVRVHARNPFGLSAASNEVNFTLGASRCTAPPPAPGPLVATVAGASVNLAWGSVTGAASYVLEAGSATGRSDVLVANVGSSLGVSATAPTGTFFVRVRASNACGLGLSSNEVTAVVGGVTAVPSVPNGLTFTVDAGRNVTLSWRPPNGGSEPSGYLLEAGSAPGQTDIGTVPVTDVFLSVPRVPPGTYFVRVRAVNSFGRGTPTADLAVVVP